jgi:hypothetical protein
VPWGAGERMCSTSMGEDMGVEDQEGWQKIKKDEDFPDVSYLAISFYCFFGLLQLAQAINSYS